MGNPVYDVVLKNEQNRIVFGSTNSYSHGSIDTMAEWKAQDQKATNYLNSLVTKKRITSIDRKKAQVFLQGGYGLSAEALTSDRARKISSDAYVQSGLNAQLPFHHNEFKTAGDIFESVQTEKMATDLANYNNSSQDTVSQVNSLKSTESADNLFWDDMTVEQRQTKLASISADAERNVSDKDVANWKQNNSEFTTNLSEEKVAAESLKSTYSSGDAGLARQLEARTYGVNDDLSITPGTETKWVDEIGDTYGTSKGTAEMTKLAEEKVANTTEQTFGRKSRKDLQNEREVVQSKIVAEKNAEMTKLAEEKAIVNTGNADYDAQSQFRYPLHKDGLSYQELDHGAGYVEPVVTAEEKARLNNEYLGTDGQALVNAGQDQDFIDAKNKALKKQEKALQTANEKADEKLIATATRIKEEKEEKAEESKRLTGLMDEHDKELHGGEAEATQLHKLTEIKDKLDEERHGGDFEGIAQHQSHKFGAGMDDISDKSLYTPHSQLGSGMGGLSEHLAELERERVRLYMAYRDKNRQNYLGQGMDGGDFEGIDAAAAQHQEWVKKSKNDPFRFSTFAYPSDVTTNMENGHYILFYVNVQDKTKYSYDGINADGDIVPVGDWVMTHENRERETGAISVDSSGRSADAKVTETYMHSEWKGGANAGEIDFHKRRVLIGHKGNILRSNQAHLMKGRKSYQGMDAVHKTTTRITDSVALYLPPGVSDNLSVGYDNSELGMAGFLAFSGGEVVQKWKDQDFEGVTDTVWSTGKGVIVEAIKRLGLGAAGALLDSDNLTGAFDKAFGQTLNPYIEVTFNSMGMRTFNYTFHFAPKSKQETQDVKDIIQLFRFHMAPELKGTNHRYLTLPSTFDIHYMYQSTPETAKENPFYNKIATCVLTGCDVNYTPDGVKSFESGAPTQINMTLNFQETKMLTKQKINDGF